VLDFLGHSVDRSSTKQYAPNLLSKKALKLIAAGRTFPPVGPSSETHWVASLKDRKEQGSLKVIIADRTASPDI